MQHEASSAAIQDRLWKTIHDARAGMLAARPPNHMQPMHAFGEPDEGRIYFVSESGTDLVRALNDEAEAHFVVIAKDQSLWACVRGRLTAAHDQRLIDRYWSPLVAAWYPGKDRTDPSIALLTFEVEEADVWLSDAGPAKFAFEIAKANLTDTAPDVGARRKLDLR